MTNEINKFLEQKPNENKNQYNCFLAYAESQYNNIEEWYEHSNIKFKLKTIYNWSSQFDWKDRINSYKNYRTVNELIERQYGITSHYNDVTSNIISCTDQMFNLLDDKLHHNDPNTSDINNLISGIEKLTKLNRLVNNMSEHNIAIAERVAEEKEEEYGLSDALAYIESIDTKEE